MGSSGNVLRDMVDGVAVLQFDTARSGMNVVGPDVFAALDRELDEIENDTDLVGLVLGSAGRDFSAGADVRWLGELRSDPDRSSVIRRSQATSRRIADFKKPVVAAINGVALGGGFELALACSARIASAEPRTRVGLPEVTLALLPGGGGTQLLPRLLPLDVALDMLLGGGLLSGEQALAIGVVDELVPHNRLVDISCQRVREMARTGAPLLRPAPSGEDVQAGLGAARSGALSRARGNRFAMEQILAAVETGLVDGEDEGYAKERECFEAVLESTDAAGHLHQFQTTRRARRIDRSIPATPWPVKNLMILGAGMMGSGLAAHSIDRGLHVRIRDVDEGALLATRRYSDRVLRSRYEGRDDLEYRYRERIHRLSLTTELSGAGAADVIIEAVFEDLELKHQVIREAEPLVSEHALFATNTSALPIARLAEATAKPDRFLGMHFFSPVDRMELVEIIPHEGTSAGSINAALRLAVAMGKTPVVVGDSPGFFTSRVYGRWLDEGIRLLIDGARVEEIDRAAVCLGFPVGPLRALDEVSLQLHHKISNDPITGSVISERVDVRSARKAIASLVDAGHRGRKSGRGFWTYGEDGRRAGPDARVYDIMGVSGAEGSVAAEEIRDRILYSFVSEALLCLDEGILASPGDGDVASVLGIGFPRQLGGPFFHVDLIGAAEAVAALERIGGGTGNFAVAEGLRQLAMDNGTYAETGP